MQKVAVVGLGSIAARHRKNLKYLLPATTVFAVSSSGRLVPEKVSDCDYLVSSIEELVKVGPDMVIIASPSPYHALHVIPFINAGIPALIEKPLAASIADAELIKKSQARNNTPVAVGYCLRYLSSATKIKRLLEQQYIGEIYNSFIQVGQYLPDWREKSYTDSVTANIHLGGGALLELSHELDYAHWLLGGLQVEHVILRSSKELRLEVEDMADITLTGHKGMVCHIHLDLLQRAPKRQCCLIGSKGSLDWDLIKNKITFTGSKGAEVLYSEPNWDKNNMYVDLLSDFFLYAQRKKNRAIGLVDARKTLELIESIKLIAKRVK